MDDRLSYTVLPLRPSEPYVLRRELGRVLSHPANAAYLDALMGKNAVVTATRLSALSLLPPLLVAAGVEPSSVVLTRDAADRPCLHRPGGQPADINLSHSAGHIACALWMGKGSVGIDVEEPVPATRARALTDRFLSDGEKKLLEDLLHDMDLSCAISRIWTIREALAKQSGQGMPLRFDASRLPPDVRVFSRTVSETGAQLTICCPAIHEKP